MRFVYVDAQSGNRPVAGVRIYGAKLPSALPGELRISSGGQVNRLRLDQEAAAETGGRLVRTLIEAVEHQEWLEEIEKRRKWFTDDSRGRELVTADLTRLLAELANRSAMQRLISASEEDLGRDNPDLKPVLESLARTAKQLCASETLLILPESVPATAWTALWRGLIFGIGQAVVEAFRDHARASPVTQLNYSLAFAGEKLADGEPDRHPVSLRQQLTDTLITQASPRLAHILEQMRRPGPVLLEGPTGSGKSLAAKLYADLHAERTQERKFLRINVSAIQEEQLEYRLRGYRQGAFTGATNQEGWFSLADGGVLFLDEFQKAPSWVQTQLLDAIGATTDQVEISKIGVEKLERFRVKLILAVNEPLDALQADGRFRDDLMHRVRRFIAFQPLEELLAARESPASLGMTSRAYAALLVTVFRWKFGRHFPLADSEDVLGAARCMFPEITPEAMETLISSRWPGNFREFEKVCADIFDDMDVFYEKKVTRDMVLRAFAHRRFRPEGAAHVGLAKVVEDALRREGYVVAKACRHLEQYRMGNSATLSKWLRQHKAELSYELRSQRRIDRLLNRAPRKSKNTRPAIG